MTMEATSEPKEEPVATCLLDDRMDVEVIESNVAALGEVQVPESPNARDASMDIDPTPGVVEDEAKPKSIEPNNISLPKEENAVDPGKEGCSAVREDDDSAVGPSSAAQSSDPLSKGKGKEVELDREKAQDPNEKEKPGTSPSSATQPSDPSKEEKIEFAPSARNDPNRKRSHLDFPLIDVISHLKKVAGVEYDYYEKEPRGYRTEEGFKWSLHKNDWFFIYTHRPHLATLVTRSMLHHMGMYDAELPPILDEDLEEAAGLPKQPMCIEDSHYQMDHCPDACYWPKMTDSMGGFKSTPTLDRTLPHNIDFLMVKDPKNRTHVHDRSSKEERVIKYSRVDPKLIGISWVPLPPDKKKPALTANISFVDSLRLGSGNGGVAWEVVMDLPYYLAHEMFECCYRPEIDPRVTTQHVPACAEDLPDQKQHVTKFKKEDMEASDPNPEQWFLPTRFTVVAKITGVDHHAHTFSRNEAKIYDELPVHLSQDWSGYQSIRPIQLPQPACAVVPKTYGYYAPDVTYNKLSNGFPLKGKDHPLCPILLLENCGKPVSPHRLSDNDKRTIYSMLERLHNANIVQQSVAPRNILVQPGPLHVLPENRSMEKPSFRIIDFGRGRKRKDDNDKSFKEWCLGEANKMMMESLELSFDAMWCLP